MMETVYERRERRAKRRTLAEAGADRVRIDEKQLQEVMDPNNPKGKRKHLVRKAAKQ
jgi:hypothetical protein